MSFFLFLKFRAVEALLIFIVSAVYFSACKIIALIQQKKESEKWKNVLFIMPMLSLFMVYVTTLYIVSSFIWCLLISSLFTDNIALQNATAPLVHIVFVIILLFLYKRFIEPNDSELKGSTALKGSTFKEPPLNKFTLKRLRSMPSLFVTLLVCFIVLLALSAANYFIALHV